MDIAKPTWRLGTLETDCVGGTHGSIEEDLFAEAKRETLEEGGLRTYEELLEELRSLRADHEMLTKLVGKLARKLEPEEDDEDGDEEEDMPPLILDEPDKVKFVSLLLEDEGAFNEFLIKNVVAENDWIKALVYDEFDVGDNRMIVPSTVMRRHNLFN